jgi:ATP-binding cassette subfamily F protein uup
MAPPRNLVNLSHVGKAYSTRTVLGDITLGAMDGQRIGVVGGNGEGKSTLLALIAGDETPDGGAVTRTRGVVLARLRQEEELRGFETVREALAGERAEYEAVLREIVSGLLGGRVALEAPVATLSGGERRRVALARLLLEQPDLLLLDEPTNHLDVEAISWLAAHLVTRRHALLVVTHDRWFLDAVCTDTWEVAAGAVHQYEGGYAAYILARAERERLESAREDRRRQLVRKELAWLRRGPPARTSKPKFRIEAASALIADVPPAREPTELLAFAARRLGTKVLDAEDVTFAYDSGDPPLLRRLTWRLGPGERVAVVGRNGSGKTTLLKLLAGELEPSAGRVERGQTVQLAFLSQEAAELPGGVSVLESLEQIRRRARLSGGEEITAGRLAERFGFRGDRARVIVDDLSGGERRRLALMRLLMGEPNVLLLDEPTNDLDLDTLRALEDLLDGWAGTLVAVSHDRYFVERVCENVFALEPGGGVRHLPGGIDQYLAEGRDPGPPPAGAAAGPGRGSGLAPRSDASASASASAGAGARAARAQARRLEREIDRAAARERALHEAIAEHATDSERLTELSAELTAVVGEREELEAAWLEAAEALEG